MTLEQFLLKVRQLEFSSSLKDLLAFIEKASDKDLLAACDSNDVPDEIKKIIAKEIRCREWRKKAKKLEAMLKHTNTPIKVQQSKSAGVTPRFK